jgi:hypothetical protein
MDSLTDRQQILDFIQSKKFIAPTVREVAKHFELSLSAVQAHIEALRRKGHLPEKETGEVTTEPMTLEVAGNRLEVVQI